MQQIMRLPCEDPAVPECFQWYYSANWEPKLFCIQDGVHMCVRFYRQLMARGMVLGKGNISAANLKCITKMPKMVHGMSDVDLTSSYDQMSFKAVLRTTDDRDIDQID